MNLYCLFYELYNEEDGRKPKSCWGLFETEKNFTYSTQYVTQNRSCFWKHVCACTTCTVECCYDGCGFQANSFFSFNMKAIRALLLLATVMALRNVVLETVLDA